MLAQERDSRAMLLHGVQLGANIGSSQRRCLGFMIHKTSDAPQPTVCGMQELRMLAFFVQGNYAIQLGG
jgi:hypothetical protein